MFLYNFNRNLNWLTLREVRITFFFGAVSIGHCTTTVACDFRLKLSNGPAWPSITRARARHGPIVPPCRACIVLRACWSAQARHVGRFTGRTSPKSTWPNHASGQLIARNIENPKFKGEYKVESKNSNFTSTLYLDHNSSLKETWKAR